MKNTNDKELNKNYRKVQLKLIFRDLDGIIKHQGFPIDQIDQSGDDCINNPINAIIQNNELLDEKLVETARTAKFKMKHKLQLLMAGISYVMKFSKKW